MNFVKPIRAKFSHDVTFNAFACSICDSPPKFRARAIIKSPEIQKNFRRLRFTIKGKQ